MFTGSVRVLLTSVSLELKMKLHRLRKLYNSSIYGNVPQAEYILRGWRLGRTETTFPCTVVVVLVDKRIRSNIFIAYLSNSET